MVVGAGEHPRPCSLKAHTLLGKSSTYLIYHFTLQIDGCIIMTTMKNSMRLLLSFLIVAGITIIYFVYRFISQSGNSGRDIKVLQWIRNSEDHTEWAIQSGTQCQDAPFIFPTDGFIGYLWDDSFRPGHHHQGIDIFGGEASGVVPVIAAYDGYLTRLPDWKSTVIIRIPNDPHPARPTDLDILHAYG